MTELLLQPAPARGPNDYEVIADDWIVGRIVLSDTSPAERPWLWSLDRPHPDARLRGDTRGGHGRIRQELAARITRLQRVNHLLGAAIAGRSCNITDATPKVIAVAKVRANIVIHICSSIAWQAGAQPVSQPPAPGKRAAADDSHSVRLLLATSDTFFFHSQNVPLRSLAGHAAGACNLSRQQLVYKTAVLKPPHARR